MQIETFQKIFWPVIWVVSEIGKWGGRVVAWLRSLCVRQEVVQNVATRAINELLFVPEGSLDIAKKRFCLLEEIKSKPDARKEELELAYRRLFQAATQHLYQNFSHLDGEIQILVKNAADGYGDHAHGVQVASCLIEDFPNARPELHTFFEQNLTSLPQLARPDPARCSAHFYPEYQEVAAESVLDLKEKISRAACVLDVSYATSRKDLGLEKVRLGPTHTYLREYGTGDYTTRDPLHELYMGLDDLEEGIFVKEIPKKALQELDDARLKGLLLLGSRHLHLFYHKLSGFYQASDIYIAALIHQEDDKPIDIVMPLDVRLEWLMHWKMLEPEKLKSLGVGTLQLIKKESVESVLIQNQGKEIRIIHPQFLPQHDFYTLLANASAPFGSTGDHSFTDALSLPIATHYELRGHKFFLFKSFKKLAEKLGCKLVEEYLEASGALFDGREETFRQEFQAQLTCYDGYKTALLKRMAAKIFDAAKKLATCLKNRDFHEEWKKIAMHIRKERNVRKQLRFIVARHLAMAHYPQLAASEEQAFQDFRSGKKSIQTVHEELIRSLS